MKINEKKIEENEANFNYEIKRVKSGGDQAAIYIKSGCFNKLKDEFNVLVEEKIENYPTNGERINDKVYLLNDYEFLLGSGILEIIGDEYNQEGNEFLISFPQVTDGQPQLMKSVYKKLSEENSGYKWFVEFYDNNVSDNRLIINFDSDKKIFELDIEFPRINELISFKPVPLSEIKYSHNRIIFGAPGTGKSKKLDDEKAVFRGRFERVTFHPNYSYAQFVGTYKPFMKRDENDNPTEKIIYKFVPGPFLRVFVNAINTGKPYLLLIEEINRANVAAVFGDVFQLLDRKDGESEYEIETSEDLRDYLKDHIEVDGFDFERIKIPNNMFIWATMNSADQGVFPLDTAFKRRWDFEYMDINDCDDDFKKINVKLSKNTNVVNWNDLRKAINRKLSECNVNEDKLLGPYFLSKEILDKKNNKSFSKDNEFIKAFKYKVLMYLYEDAGKHCDKLFSGCDDKSTFSAILDEFDKKGEEIFGKDILNKD